MRFVEDKVEVEFTDDAATQVITLQSIEKRVKLPWHPRELHNSLIIFRRRRGKTNEYVEDLRVRRELLRRLLHFLTMPGNWRPQEGPGPLHKYYTDFDWLSDAQFEEIFPVDDVPEDLHFEDLDEPAQSGGLSPDSFRDWLYEGKYSCEIAQCLLYTWYNRLSGGDNSTVLDLYEELLARYAQECREKGLCVPTEVSTDFVARFIYEHCNWQFKVIAQKPA